MLTQIIPHHNLHADTLGHNTIYLAGLDYRSDIRIYDGCDIVRSEKCSACPDDVGGEVKGRWGDGWLQVLVLQVGPAPLRPAGHNQHSGYRR